ncbi:MAG: response regulator transcription factor, partial [Bacteroidota bacterium]
MKCLIVDDNELARTVLRQMASQVPFLEVVGECADGFESLDFLGKQAVDLLLLDVEMPGLSGLEFLRSLPTHPLVILVTSKKDYAFEAFELNVVDFLAKPVAFPRFLRAVNHAREIFDTQNLPLNSTEKGDGIFVRTNNSLLKISFDEILWVQAMGDYVVFQLDGKKHLIHSTLRQVED